MINEPIELETVPYDKTMYPGYLVRFEAFLMDLLVMAPISIPVVYFNSLGKDVYYFTFIPLLAFSTWYHIYLLKRYGATPGKLILGIRVVKTNGQDPEWKEAFLRFIPTLCVLIMGTIISLVALSNADATHFEGLGWRQQREYLQTLAPELFTINLWLGNLFFWSDVIVMLSNRRKRALHDRIAGTVVVSNLYMERLQRNQSAFAETE